MPTVSLAVVALPIASLSVVVVRTASLAVVVAPCGSSFVILTVTFCCFLSVLLVVSSVSFFVLVLVSPGPLSSVLTPFGYSLPLVVVPSLLVPFALLSLVVAAPIG